MSEPSAWDAWLAGADCLGTLEGAARIVMRQAARIGLPDGLLPCGPLGAMSPADLEDCAHAVSHDLWVYLRTRPPAWRERVDLAWLATQGERFLLHRIGREYLRHLKDQARTYGVNPWRALYRRLRQVLQEDGSVHTRSTPRGTAYSLDPDGIDCGDEAILRAVSYDQWASPLPIASVGELHRANRLLALARFFWEQAVARLGGRSCFVPVRELVHYLGRHYEGLAAPRETPSLASHEGGDEDAAALAEQPGGDTAAERSLVHSRLQSLAEQLAASWTDRQRAAFHAIHGAGMTLEAAARRLGYKGASGASYVYRSALERLRDFCLLWPGLSPPDLDETLFDDFVERVLALCRPPD